MPKLGAFVELDSHQLANRAPWPQMCIYSAGVWHNFVVAAVGLSVRRQLPRLLSPWYHFHGGKAAVSSVARESALSAELNVGDVLTSVDGSCTITSARAYTQCIERLRTDFDLGITGFCYPAREAMSKANSSSPNCCADTSESGGTKLCFRILNRRQSMKYSCLGARNVFDTSESRCLSDVDCAIDKACLKYSNDSSTNRLIQLTVQDRRRAVLFLGQPGELVRDIHLTDYVIRPTAQESWHPSSQTAELVLEYVVSISIALGLLNVIPAFGFDGQYSLTAAIEMTYLSPTQKAILVTVICIGCTCLLGLNVLLILGKAVIY